MKNKLLILFSLCLIVLPIASADLINPGYHGITINNYIDNLNDFPDYVFVSAGEGPPGMCVPIYNINHIQIVGSDGKIGNQYYKACQISVYAIPEDKFNETKIEKINSEEESMSSQEVISYFESIGGKEVITGISTYNEVSDASPVKEENNHYTISLSQVKIEPDKRDVPKNILIYLYIILPIIAILIIVFILIKRKRK
jgi:hypothetical protein